MARTQKLKVYRTVAGFNDAYVAAPSQRAALEAWGSDRDLFARGIAELVTDPALTAEPLASPGVVVKLSRGTTAEQINALPTPEPRAGQIDDPERSDASRQSRKSTLGAPAKPAPKPKPSSTKLEVAETALETITADYDSRLKALADREAELVVERGKLEKQQRSALGVAEATLKKERQAYDDALQQWRKAKGAA